MVAGSQEGAGSQKGVILVLFPGHMAAAASQEMVGLDPEKVLISFFIKQNARNVRVATL